MSASNIKEMSDNAASAVGTAAGAVRDLRSTLPEGVQRSANSCPPSE